jgi:hypothetical protein
MSLSTRLDKLEAAMRGRDGGDPPDQPGLSIASKIGPKVALSRSRNGKGGTFPNSKPMHLIGWLPPERSGR